MAVPPELVPELVLLSGVLVAVVAGVVPEVLLAVAPPLELAPPLGLTPPLPDGVGLLPVVAPPIALPLVELAGALVVPVVLGGELLLVCVADACVDVDAQPLGEDCAAAAGLDCVTSWPADGAGDVAWPKGVPASLGELLLLMLSAWPRVSPTETNA